MGVTYQYIPYLTIRRNDIMIKYENDCVGCPPEIGCLGSTCPYVNVPHCYCDNCQGEFDELYNYNGEQWCEDCILKDCGKVDYDYD